MVGRAFYETGLISKPILFSFQTTTTSTTSRKVIIPLKPTGSGIGGATDPPGGKNQNDNNNNSGAEAAAGAAAATSDLSMRQQHKLVMCRNSDNSVVKSEVNHESVMKESALFSTSSPNSVKQHHGLLHHQPSDHRIEGRTNIFFPVELTYCYVNCKSKC